MSKNRCNYEYLTKSFLPALSPLSAYTNCLLLISQMMAITIIKIECLYHICQNIIVILITTSWGQKWRGARVLCDLDVPLPIGISSSNLKCQISASFISVHIHLKPNMNGIDLGWHLQCWPVFTPHRMSELRPAAFTTVN